MGKEFVGSGWGWGQEQWGQMEMGTNSCPHATLYSLPFLFPLFPHLEVALRIQLRFGGVLLAPFSGRERQLQPLDTLHGLQIKQECVCGRAQAPNAFLVYLEPIERVWRLQMSSYF